MSEAVNEYAFSKEVLRSLDEYKVSIKALNKKVQDYEKMVALLNEKIEVAKAYRQTDNVQSIHTVRTFLAGEGVPYEDLNNWVIEGNKAVREEKGENADVEG